MKPHQHDYSELRELGFKGGLETHQQLATPSKLFCRCPTTIRNDSHHQELLRHMRPTLSEFGEYDGTALMEFKTKKQVHYLLYNDSVCTYEMDDTPPFKADSQAVSIALRLAMMFNMSLVDEIHITRKQYLDGSIPTGFQRTAIVGVNGMIPFLGRQLRFIQMSLEEDACREVSDVGHHVWFRTDRLSIPLVEPVTAPELETPLEMALAAKLVGETMRSTHLVRRGIGSVRQDVNVSIRGGHRVEIKGVPRIAMIEPLCRIEAYRQKALLDLRSDLISSRLRPDGFSALPMALSPEQAETEGFDPGYLSSRGFHAAALVLREFSPFLRRETQPGMTFLDELDGRVRVIACLEGSPVVMEASDRLRADMGVTPDDSLLVLCGTADDVETAGKEIHIRISEAFQGVPPETRQALPGGTTTFERILPGADRMYPDTDLPPEPISPGTFDRLKTTLPPPPWERRRRYGLIGVSEHLVDRLLNLELCDMFDELLKLVDWKPSALANLLADRIRASRRNGLDWMGVLGCERITETLVWANGNRISPVGARMILDYLAARPEQTPDQAFEAVRPDPSPLSS
jgi:glutamyl-tRNA(Gln) amidotransferase subunit E